MLITRKTYEKSFALTIYIQYDQSGGSFRIIRVIRFTRELRVEMLSSQFEVVQLVNGYGGRPLLVGSIEQLAAEVPKHVGLWATCNHVKLKRTR